MEDNLCTFSPCISFVLVGVLGQKLDNGETNRGLFFPYGLMTSAAKRKGSPCLQDDNSRSDKKLRYSMPSLPEDIWHHIHSLLPLRDAARTACVSRTFLGFWRCYPNLTITRETLGLVRLEDEKDGMSYETSCDLATKIDHILRNHSGTGVKALKLEINDFPVFCTYGDLDRWLHIAVRPGIEKLDLWLRPILSAVSVYNFPCSLLLNGSGKSLRHLHLSSCTFRPTAGLDCLRSLTSLELYEVRVTEDDLRCLLSSLVALEELRLVDCEELIFLKIPSLLQRLSNLVVHDCENLEVIESKAPNLSGFEYMGPQVQLSLGDSLQDIYINGSGRGWDIVHYAWAKLPCMVPNLEVLEISTSYLSDTLVVPAGKFLHLRHLFIDGFCRPDYDHFSLVSFLDACPYLETFRLFVEHDFMEDELVLGDFSHDLRQMPGHLHSNIKDVQILGFYSTKSIIELTCHILENATSLESLTLDTSYTAILCSDSKNGKCLPMNRDMIMEAHKALLAVKRYILGKVPSSVELKVVEPCSRCNDLEILVQERKLVEPAQSESAQEFPLGKNK
ncbi:uncharacterized protein LOC100835160 isoform X2 [Brachypodium distachyon]|nr:uncharacterized protein LOC100835160 isoform X2 [Brachypodium distachyon]XP_024319160.1 uncharacterized protein LOC100835160 isoform X2 [Brachypodium distachyon]XP_024319161.1 uncharacterized protein LOC100835160 isoform X2 [Brachypodium distachyon]XP_024319162.1 uncharacterized protein LOC100835160 isoform X2 [Brachypodium distachyon]XP_024319163.1 uncharacterized protein LOC100835160 isoform X2 [Brachypodium distachyon]|eukprot:XP_024319159.1 uncharacterized protein LOC100835160 isoform X2 [Brachypodium distachyon]